MDETKLSALRAAAAARASHRSKDGRVHVELFLAARRGARRRSVLSDRIAIETMVARRGHAAREFKRVK